MIPELSSPWWYLPAALLGACVGSFLNVVIYRLPAGLSVNHPKRSFCPLCHHTIPWWRNIPLLSWLLLRGKCADCHAPIPFRYWLVELTTALLFVASWHFFPALAAAGLFLLMSLLVAITFIDAEHQIIPASLTYIGLGVGLASSLLDPQLLYLGGTVADGSSWWRPLLDSALGWTLGFFGLWSVVLLGKMLFGKKKIDFSEPTDWQLIDATTEEDPLLFSCDGEELPWHEIFFRKSDEMQLLCSSIVLDGVSIPAGLLRIRETEITLPDGKQLQLEALHSLSGKVTQAVIPREAMGMGDPHLLGMIGAFIGGAGALFTVCASAFFAILWAVIARIGRGKPLPYGPFLALGALAWIFGGWRLWNLYLEWITPP